MSRLARRFASVVPANFRSTDAMPLRKGTCAAILACLPATSFAINSMLQTEVEQLSPAIRSVQTCGAWSADGREGRYRVVVGDVIFSAGQELYVQRIVQPYEAPDSHIVSTAAVRELNDDHNQYEIADVRCSVKGRTTRLIVRAINEHDEAQRPRSITIRLNADGSYQLEPPPRR
jgi:hypothetical protein